jgi:hypothetical protein
VPSINNTVDYQGENGTFTGGAGAQPDPYASGGSFAAFFNSTGAACELQKIDGGAGGPFTMMIRYAALNSTTLDLYVNGALIGPLSYPATGAWTGAIAYSTVTVPVTLNAGTANTITFQRDAANGAINVDKITLQDGALGPQITTPPTPQYAVAGGPATFTAAASGTAPLSYQWQLNNQNVPGATSASYTVPAASSANAGNYTLLVSNASGSTTSIPAALTLVPEPNLLSVASVQVHAGTPTPSPCPSPDRKAWRAAPPTAACN